MTSLSIIVPTAGRASLERTILSYLPQMAACDELLVMGDTLDGPLPQTEAICAKYAPLVRYVPTKHKEHTFGHLELNDGLDLARGDYVLGNDDDDCATPDALPAIRAVIGQLPDAMPLLFRYRSYHGPIYWHAVNKEGEPFEGCLEVGHIGGHCLVAPNLPGMVGRFTERYQGDWDWIMNTLTRWPDGIHSAAWVDHQIAIARPGL